MDTQGWKSPACIAQICIFGPGAEKPRSFVGGKMPFVHPCACIGPEGGLGPFFWLFGSKNSTSVPAGTSSPGAIQTHRRWCEVSIKRLWRALMRHGANIISWPDVLYGFFQFKLIKGQYSFENFDICRYRKIYDCSISLRLHCQHFFGSFSNSLKNIMFECWGPCQIKVLSG